MRTHARHCDRHDHGFVLAFLAISILTLMLVVGMAIDAAAWYLQAARLQRAADSAALAAANYLPNAEQATQMATASLAANNISSSTGYTISISPTPSRVKISAKRINAKTAIMHAVLPSISITRASYAERSFSEPVLGSPFNVLGTGDLTIPAPNGTTLEKQNFWLAINGPCSPMEDGDMFTAAWDYNKGPFNTSPTNRIAGYPYEYKGTNSTKTNCRTSVPQTTPPITGAVKNQYYTDALNSGQSPSYSYYIDVPKPPAAAAAGATVTIRLYDPSFAPSDSLIDDAANAAGDSHGASLDFVFHLFDTRGTADVGDDIKITSVGMPSNWDSPDAYAKGKQTPKDWFSLYTLSGAAIANGGTFRVQVAIQELERDYADQAGLNPSTRHGWNAFSIGAFPSWIGNSQLGCNSNTDIYCPRVYAKGAESVLVKLKGLSPSTETPIAMYFAELDVSAAGTTARVWLWDPGESVTKIEIQGPGGTKFPFVWKTTDGSHGPTSANYIDSSGGGGKVSANLSNEYKFNDRLLVLDIAVPSNYADLVAANNNDKWLRLVYTVAGDRADRTTWGVSMTGATSVPPHLVDR